jgi:hypothetical protein
MEEHSLGYFDEEVEDDDNGGDGAKNEAEDEQQDHWPRAGILPASLRQLEVEPAREEVRATRRSRTPCERECVNRWAKGNMPETRQLGSVPVKLKTMVTPGSVMESM